MSGTPMPGRCITMDDMHRDVDTMLRNNINAVRTCHYPDQSWNGTVCATSTAST